MDNAEIATALNGIADLLEIQDGNRFKIRAYRNAVRTVTGLTRPLEAMVEAGADLTALPGIGKQFVLAAQQRDYTLVMGVVLIYSFLIILLNLAADLTYRVLDPRSRAP